MSHVRSVVIVMAGLSAASSALAGVVPIGPEAFGPAGSVEDFENIVNVLLPVTPPWSTFADVPVPYHFASGVSITAANPTADGGPSIEDFLFDDPDSPEGWGLSLEGGSIVADTVIPSGTAFLGHDTYTPEGTVPPIRFTFDTAVAQVGAYTEASTWQAIGYDGLVTLEAFDVGGGSLGSVQIYANGAGVSIFGIVLGPLDSWIGLGTVDGAPLIRSVEFTGRSLVVIGERTGPTSASKWGPPRAS